MTARKTLAEQITSWIGIISAVITISLTIINSITQKQIESQAADINREKTDFEQNYQLKTQDLESSKEKTERLKFVQTLLNDSLSADEQKQKINVNLIRLTLHEEADALFAGLKLSADTKLQNIGNTGAEIKKKVFSIAEEKEREGFQNLINGDYDGAATAFQVSEDTFNSYHMVYELARLIRANKSQMNNSAKKKEVFQKIVSDYSYGAPPDLLVQIKTIANQ